MTELTSEQINAVLTALRPHFDPAGVVHLDLAVTRLNMAGLQQELAEARVAANVAALELAEAQAAAPDAVDNGREPVS